MRTVTLVLLSILIAACATRQRAPPGAGPASNAVPEAAVVALAPAGTTPPPAAPVADHPTDPNVPDPNILKRGYKAVHLNEYVAARRLATNS